MVVGYVGTKFVRPAMVAILAVLVAGGLIFGIGQLLLSIHDAELSKELERKELWVGVALTVLILLVATFIATRPPGTLGPLDREVAIGSKPITGAYTFVPVDRFARYGARGTVSDLESGYTLYARNGALAELIDVMSSVEDIGELSRTLLHAKGAFGAPSELWIPVEAVSAVYPETRSAFLAIAGDEIEALGWHKPPLSFVRGERRRETPLY